MKQYGYRKGELAGAPAPLELPTGYPRSAAQDNSRAFEEFALDTSLSERLRDLSRRHDASLFTTLMAGWAALLARLSSHQDLLIGTPLLPSGDVREPAGHFPEMLVVHLNLGGPVTVSELIEQAKAEILAALQEQKIPRKKNVESTTPTGSLPDSPLFEFICAWQNLPQDELEKPRVNEQVLLFPQVDTEVELLLNLRDDGNTISGRLEYAASLFDEATIKRYLGYFSVLLQGIVTDDTQQVDRLPLLDESERHMLLYDFNATTVEFPSEICVHQMFEEQVAKSPDAVAVTFKGATISYSELNRRANRLAHFLLDLGVRPDKPVAICTQRGFEMVIALMAVLKAGGAYVPLDPAYPVERLLFMLRDSEPLALLTQQDLAAKFAGCEAKVPFIDLTSDGAKWDGLPDCNPNPAAVGLHSSHLAYVIYTSGSTGKPKGVAMPHRALVNLLCWQIGQPNFSQSKRIMQFAALGFDVSFQETASALCSGRALILSEEEGLVSPASLLNFIGKNEIDEVFLPYAMLSLLADGIGESAGAIRNGESPREIITAGEQLRINPGIRNLFQSLPDCRLQNQYGPTETHVVTSFNMPWNVGEWPNLPPIGRPIANTQIYILDPYGEPVPIGVMGEIYVGGVCVARGYLNRPELTAERFVLDPFSSQSGARMYRTGDLGRWTPDGNIGYLGRSDFQVKIRGFRVELGEIETRLAEYPGVGETVVIAREDTFGNKRLIAYYTTSRGAGPMNSTVGAERLRAHLLAMLPEHMIPVAYVQMPSLPLSPNGKLDRKALPAPEIDSYATGGYETPHGEIEIKLAGIWAELLNVDRVGRHDNFFWLGGDSILSVKMISRAQQEGLNLNLGAMMAYQTISELAAAATELGNTRARHAISRSAVLGEAWDNDRVEIEI